MKRSIICFLCILACISLYGQDPRTDKPDTIAVEGNTIIVLSERYPDEMFLYDGYISGKIRTFRGANDCDGAKAGLVAYNSDKESASKYIVYKDDGDRCFKINIVVQGEIAQPVELSFPIVDKYDKETKTWKTVAVRRITLEPKASSDQELSDKVPGEADKDSSAESGQEGEVNTNKYSSRSTGLFSSIDKLLAPGLIKPILAVMLFLLAAWCLLLAARIKKLSRRLQEVSDALDSAKRRPQETRPVVPSKSELLESIRADIPGIIASGFMPDITRSIDEKVNQAVSKVIIPVQPVVSEPKVAEEVPKSYFRSSNVVYDSVTNTFSVSDKGAVHIFEIFERDGDFFLTLVDDPAIRQEFISVLGNYSKCIKVTQEASFPVRADVPENGYGHLFKEGDIFRVDTSRLLNIVLR